MMKEKNMTGCRLVEGGRNGVKLDERGVKDMQTEKPVRGIIDVLFTKEDEISEKPTYNIFVQLKRRSMEEEDYLRFLSE